jgi:hypothetical protein
MAPAMTVYVHDAYVAGKGFLAAKLLGLMTVLEQPSTPELAQGELMRFFAEGYGTQQRFYQARVYFGKQLMTHMPVRRLSIRKQR